MKSFITAQMATYPARLEILPLAINSLLPQVDKLNVMLNGYNGNFIPACCKHPKIHVEFTDNSMTDGAKFFNIEKLKGYIFTVDDDLLYPPDYVSKSIQKIEEHKRKYVITYHGRVFSPRPIYSFYRDRAEMYQCLQGFEGDHFVDCGGDGVMAWHSDTFKMRYEYCELPNMSQLWIALACNKAGVRQLAVGHPVGWIQDTCLDLEESIWFKHNEDDQVQTDLVNTRWK